MRRVLGAALSAFLLLPVLLLSQATAQVTFGVPKSVPQGSVTEPGIDIGPATPAAPGGTIFVNGPRGLPSRSNLWRSVDNGGTYNRVPFPSPYGQLPGGGDSDVVISPAGRLYFLDLWVGSNSLARSDNGGDSWSWGTPLTSLGLSDRQWIGLGGPGDAPGSDTVYIVYALIQPPQYVMIARSKDSGVTWTTHKVVPSPGAATGFTGQLVSDASGYVGFIYHHGGRMRYAYSTNEGSSWATTPIEADGALNTMPAVALVGSALHATWIRASDYAVMEAHSTNKGATWSPPVRISAGGTNMFSWIDARGGKVAIAWYGTDAVDFGPDQNEGPWFLRYAESLDAGATFSAPINAVADAVKTNPICTQGLGCGSGRELGDFLQLVIDLQGKSLIAYVDVVAGSIVQVVKQAS